MRLEDFIGKAKRNLNEHAGSEGFVYTLICDKAISGIDVDGIKVTDIKTVNGKTTARVEFKDPKEPGRAEAYIKAKYGDLNFKLDLVY